MNALAQQLANGMDVSAGDVMALAMSVVNSIQADGITIEQMEVHGMEITDAYIPHAVRKHEQFVSTYQTNPAARRVFQLKVLNDIKAEQ